eukprot:TRINITY_DN3832_c0_g1_i1.p1 TRINITY_DN3832_c0_g1~~TRINITY_DN3832_c0_g1_i1.p1  ORF type:complete len:297 (+),score=75.87 TRINITY_DN3832_c0_g1_i1:119-1009(+)
MTTPNLAANPHAAAHNCCCCVCVPETNYGVMQRWGKFVGVLDPGFSCFLWPCTSVAGLVSTRLRQLVIREEAKTKENVFITLSVAIQYSVEDGHVEQAFYSMENPVWQMQMFVEDAIRSVVPNMELEHLFMEKDKVSNEINEALSKKMQSYGYTIVDTLITDISPEANVKAAMNKINESKRLREAAEFQAETEKLVRVKHAEAESISKQLQGEGVAAQRKAILKGFQEGIEDMSKATGVEADETMKYTMMTQYFDMLRDVGLSNNKATIFIPHSPSSIATMEEQIISGHVNGNPKK